MCLPRSAPGGAPPPPSAPRQSLHAGAATSHYLFLGVALLGLGAAAPPVALIINFASFLARSDPTWAWNSTTTLPSEWAKSLFGGNGDLGFMVWGDTLSSLRVDVSRTTVYDDRTPDMPSYLNNFVYDQPRLPVGHFELTWPNGSLMNASARIRLFDGVAVVNLTTLTGATLGLSIFANAAVELGDSIIMLFSGVGWGVRWVPEVAQSTWSGQDARYTPNPPPVNSSAPFAPGSVLSLTSQPHLKGSCHTTAVLQSTDPSSGALTSLVVTVSTVLPSMPAADAWASQHVASVLTHGLGNVLSNHTAWWHAWWPTGGIVTLDYSILESFWYIQLYKFASASRQGRSVHDLMGPWFVDGTNWPDLHWDLNIQVGPGVAASL